MTDHPQPMKASGPTAPGFFWQGTLMLFPVLILAAAGLWSLRQDRILARHEAVEKAQAAADQIAQVWWERLFERTALEQYQEHTFQIDATGQLLFPPPAPGLPTPHLLDLGLLDDRQRGLWAAVTAYPTNEDGRASVVNACKEFLALKPPADFAARARFQMAQWLCKDGNAREAAGQFRAVAAQFPDSASDAGLPLAPLAEFKAFEAQPRSDQLNPALSQNALDHLCSNLVSHPTFLTPALLRRLTELTVLGRTSGSESPQTGASRSTSGRQTNRIESLGAPGTESVGVWDVANGRLVSTSSVEATGLPWEFTAAVRAARGPTLNTWLDRWAEQDSLRGLAQAALAQASLRAKPDVAVLSTNVAPPLPPVPAVFWFHAVDLDSNSNALGTNRAHTIWTRSASFRNAMLPVQLSEPADSSLLEPFAPRFSSSNPRWPFPLSWLAVRFGNPDGTYRVVCRPMGSWLDSRSAPKLNSQAFDQLRQNLPELPPWLGYSLELAGVTMVSSNNLEIILPGVHGAKGGDIWTKAAPRLAPEILASSSRFENGVEYLRVNIHFLSPAMFYLRQQTRSRLFGALILLAVAAALVGFVSSRHAFLRQLQLSELKSNFVSSVSHELRAPIASMRLLAESLQRGKVAEPARQADYFRFLVQECRRLSALIENVLNFARIEQGRKQYEFEPTDVLALLRQTFQLMEPAAAERQLTLQLDLPASEIARLQAPPSLDGQAMQQALINLIDNALKHSSAGQTVTLGLRVEPIGPPDASVASAPAPPPNALQLYVEDQGPGIPPEEHQRIFDRFYRRGSELRRETQGVGIGLSIVKHIAEAHHGRVIVRSAPGEGSRFTIQLPLNA